MCVYACLSVCLRLHVCISVFVCARFFFSYLGHDVFYLCFSSSARIDFSLWREKKNKKISKKMRPSGQVRVDKYCPRQAQRKRQICSTQTTVLWRLMEKVNLLVKVVLGSTSLFTVNHGPAGLDCLVCRFYWSTGAAEGPIMVDSETCLRGEIPKKVFF